MKSPKHYDKNCILRETFQSEIGVRKNNGIPTNVAFSNNGPIFNGSTSAINYNYRAIRAKSVRFILKLKTKFNISFNSPGIQNVTLIINSDNTISSFLSGSGTLTIYLNGLLISSANANLTYSLGSLKNLEICCVFNGFLKITTNIGGGAGAFLTNPRQDSPIFLYEIYNRTLTASDVLNLYNDREYTKLKLNIVDYTPNCFVGNATNNCLIQVPDSPLLCFGDGAGHDQPFWVSFWTENITLNGIGIYRSPYNSTGGYGFNNTTLSAQPLYLFTSTGNIIAAYDGSLADGQLGKVHHVYTYDGSKVFTGIKSYVNTQFGNILSASQGVYTGMPAFTGNNPFIISMATGNKIYDFRIGGGSLTQQNINDIYTGKRIGSERLWLPLCENAGNVRYDVSGNGLHGILTAIATQDGKYNVSTQNQFDYYKLYGGSTLGIMNPSFSSDSASAIKEVSFNPAPINNLTSWTLAVRMIGYKNNTLDFLTCCLISGSLTASGGIVLSNVSNIRFKSGISANYYSIGALTSLITNNYHTIIFRSDGTKVYLSVDGAAEVNVTPDSTRLRLDLLNGFNGSGANGCNGYFWDLRTWNSDIGNTEALKYHLNTMTVTPDHQYSLIGNTPAQDLVGSINGSTLAIHPIAIPLAAATQQPLLPIMTVTNPSLPVQKRNIVEVFRLNLTKGVIADTYGGILGSTTTVNGYTIPATTKMIKHGDVYGLRFTTTTPTDVLWVRSLPKNTTGGVTKIWMSIEYIVASNTLAYGISNIQTSPILSISKRVPLLFITCTMGEMTEQFIFNKNGLVSQSNTIGTYISSSLSNFLIFDGDGSHVSSKGTILYDLSISTAGILSLDEATEIWASEKWQYF